MTMTRANWLFQTRLFSGTLPAAILSARLDIYKRIRVPNSVVVKFGRDRLSETAEIRDVRRHAPREGRGCKSKLSTVESDQAPKPPQTVIATALSVAQLQAKLRHLFFKSGMPFVRSLSLHWHHA